MPETSLNCSPPDLQLALSSVSAPSTGHYACRLDVNLNVQSDSPVPVRACHSPARMCGNILGLRQTGPGGCPLLRSVCDVTPKEGTTFQGHFPSDILQVLSPAHDSGQREQRQVGTRGINN